MRILALAARILLLVQAAWIACPVAARADCAEVVQAILRHIAEGQTVEARQELLAAAQKAGVPVFLKQTGQGEIPVLLMNHETAPKIQEFLDHSIGTDIYLQPGAPNDHGALRVTDRIMDVDTPGARGYGEIHDTGIAWYPLKSYLPREEEDGEHILEVAYAVTPEERDAAEYYQRVRRAAIVRVPFTFEGAENDLTLPNMLENEGEHCFTFCKATGLDSQIRSIEAKLAASGVADAPAFLQKPEVQAFLSSARRRIMAADFEDETALRPSMIGTKANLKLLEPVLPPGIRAASNEDKVIFANWLVGYDASLRYQKLMHDLGVTSDVAVRDMRNARATAILIYDTPDQARAFSAGTYKAKGKFYSWKMGDQHPVGGPVPKDTFWNRLLGR